MFTSKKKGLFLIVAAAIAIGAPAAHADILSDAGKVVRSLPVSPLPAPPLPIPLPKPIQDAIKPPSVDVKIHPETPLKPVEVDVDKGPVHLKVTPGPLPAPPESHIDGNGFIANAVNKANDWAQWPKQVIEQKGREINAGWLHLCNEIGMMWANFKHDMEQKVFDFLAWLKALAEKYAVLALAGIGALFLARSFLHFMSGRRPHHA